MNRKAWAAIGLLALIMAVTVVIWTVQGVSMRDDFVAALRSGNVATLHRDLIGKQWTEEELSTAEVIKLPDDTGVERAWTREMHLRGRDVISRLQFEYQGTVRDNQTGIIHVFGFQRRAPRHWCWAAIHPSSHRQHLERQMEELEKMRKRRGE